MRAACRGTSADTPASNDNDGMQLLSGWPFCLGGAKWRVRIALLASPSPMPPAQTDSRRQRRARLGREPNNANSGPYSVQVSVLPTLDDVIIEPRPVSQPHDRNSGRELRPRPPPGPRLRQQSPNEETEVRRGNASSRGGSGARRGRCSVITPRYKPMLTSGFQGYARIAMAGFRLAGNSM